MIYGWVGRLGHGKSMRMVVRGLEIAKIRGSASGRCWVAANFAIQPARRPTPADRSWELADGSLFRHLPMDGFEAALRELMNDARAAGVGIVVMTDEIDELFGAHDWQSMTRGDRHRIKQSRKYGVDWLWSAQFVDQVEKSIRNITEEVELVRAYPAPTISRRERGRRPWVISGQRFRPGAVRDLAGSVDPDRRLGRTIHLYRRKHELLYDTDEIIEPVELPPLCTTHKKAAVEALCPGCHPELYRPAPSPAFRSAADGGFPLGSFVTAAAESLPAEEPAA
jgi:hypothetical protein